MYTEETASPGFWNTEILALAGVWLVAAAFIVPPGEQAALHNWLVGAITANVAIGMTGNRKWERPLAGAAAIWLFISGFVPTVRNGSAWAANEIAVGVILIVTAISAYWHLRDDVRQARPLTM